MSSSLDDKLREILEGYMHYLTGRQQENGLDWDGDYPTTIGRIKQAFADEGYVNKIDNPNMIGMYVDKDGYIYKAMTGQEWYDRFEKEMDNQPYKIDPMFSVAFEVAKKAAGIKDE